MFPVVVIGIVAICSGEISLMLYAWIWYGNNPIALGKPLFHFPDRFFSNSDNKPAVLPPSPAATKWLSKSDAIPPNWRYISKHLFLTYLLTEIENSILTKQQKTDLKFNLEKHRKKS